MSVLSPTISQADERPDFEWGSPRFWLIFCSAAIALSTLTFNDDIGPKMMGMDSVALVKFGTRLFSIVVLIRACLVSTRDRRRQYVLRTLVPLLAFVGWAMLSCLWSPLRTVSIGQSISFLSLVVLAIAAATICKSRDDFRTWLVALFWILSAAALMMVVCHFAVPGLRMVRTSQGLMHPTNAAATSCLGILLATGLWFVGRGRVGTQFIFASWALHSVVLLLAVNRGSVLALCAALVPLFALIGNRMMLAIAGVILALGTVGYIASDPGLRAVEDATSNVLAFGSRGQSTRQLTKLSGRQILWKKLWRLHGEDPWKGHGYFVTSPTGSVNVWNLRGNRTAHNFALQILVSTGRIGLTLLAIGLLVPVVMIVRYLSSDRDDRELLSFAAVLLFWFTIWGLASESIAGPVTPEGVVFFVVFGCAIGLASTRKDEREQLNDSPAAAGGDE